MVKDSKQQASKEGAASVLETSTPRVPVFENLPSEEQVAFSMSYDLLRYNLERLDLSQQATAEAEAEAAAASRRLLGNSSSVNSVLDAPVGAQLNSSGFGRGLLRLADEFRASRQGTEADDFAREVKLDDFNAGSFTDILERLFHRGYDAASFVTLFHFVARLLQRAYQERGESGFKTLCQELMTAFLIYLVSNLIKFLAHVFRTLSQERRVAVVSFLSGLAIASLASAAVGYYLLKRGG